MTSLCHEKLRYTLYSWHSKPPQNTCCNLSVLMLVGLKIQVFSLLSVCSEAVKNAGSAEHKLILMKLPYIMHHDFLDWIQVLRTLLCPELLPIMMSTLRRLYLISSSAGTSVRHHPNHQISTTERPPKSAYGQGCLMLVAGGVITGLGAFYIRKNVQENGHPSFLYTFICLLGLLLIIASVIKIGFIVYELKKGPAGYSPRNQDTSTAPIRQTVSILSLEMPIITASTSAIEQQNPPSYSELLRGNSIENCASSTEQPPPPPYELCELFPKLKISQVWSRASAITSEFSHITLGYIVC